MERTAIVDAHDHRLAGLRVGDLRLQVLHVADERGAAVLGIARIRLQLERDRIGLDVDAGILPPALDLLPFLDLDTDENGRHRGSQSPLSGTARCGACAGRAQTAAG